MPFLLFTSSCTDLTLSVFTKQWHKREASLAISYMDVLQVIVYMFCVVWIQQKERAAKAARVQVTAGQWAFPSWAWACGRFLFDHSRLTDASTLFMSRHDVVECQPTTPSW